MRREEHSPGSRIAVIGAGISGLLAARLLHDEMEVHVFEGGNYPGGHSCTVDVELGGRHYPLDTGFMVFNDHTYPNFIRLLEMLEVPTRTSDMSFSVRCERSGLEYEGSSLSGLFAQWGNLFNWSFYRMLLDVVRFNREAAEKVRLLDDAATLRQFVATEGYSQPFIDWYLVPMGAAIWSARPRDFLDFPARFIVGFFENHGLLQVAGHFAWRTIVGGSKVYVEKLIAPFGDRIRLQTPVTAIHRGEEGVTVVAGGVAERFDAVVLATHADQSLRMLADPAEDEREILSAFPYQENEAVLHTDARLLPRARQAWASWNYSIPADGERPVAVTYDLGRLQGHDAPEPLLLTLNDGSAIAAEKIVRKLVYHHPVFGPASPAAQRRWNSINGVRRTYYCGAYWGNGFHEDGVNSALAVGRLWGRRLESCRAASTKDLSGIAATKRLPTNSATLSS